MLIAEIIEGSIPCLRTNLISMVYNWLVYKKAPLQQRSFFYGDLFLKPSALYHAGDWFETGSG